MTPRGTLPHATALRFDMRGHGGSDAPVGAYTMTRLADDVVALMDELDIAQAHFCGVSVSGMVAQTLGVRHPERLLSLTLVDTITTRRWKPGRCGPTGSDRWKRMAWRDRRVDAERWLTAPFRERHPEIVERIRKMLLETPVRGYVGVAQAIEAFDLARAISRIHCPTLVVAATRTRARRCRWPNPSPVRFTVQGWKCCRTPRTCRLSNNRNASMRSSTRSWDMRHVAGSVIFRNAIEISQHSSARRSRNLQAAPMPKDKREAMARQGPSGSTT
jgi:pimeloyl-ACP methyl ester carboxylesterase